MKANLAQREAERSYGIAEQALTPGLSWSAYGLREAFNAAKHEVAPWWRAPQARIARLHTTVVSARRDGLHKLSTRLVAEHDTIVVEDLNISGMTKNRRLARAVAGVGMAELRRQLDYKSRWSGRTLLLADRWYPSSKTCSGCGVVKTKLRLSERTYHCDQCGLVLDRDDNAARNLAALAGDAAGGASTASCVGTENEPAGNPRKTTPGGGGGYRHGKTTPTSAANAA